MTVTTAIPHLSPKAKASLDELLATTVESDKGRPAVHFGLTTADGPLYLACKGDKVYGEPDKGQVNEDTTLMLYSMTKLVVSVAVLQLVDQGVLSLDDPAIVDKHAPELAAMPVLTGFDDADKPILTPRTEALTLRRLLTHTSGCSYDFTNAAVAKYQVLQGVTPRWPVAVEDNVRPLSFQPGSAWQYGVGIDWAGLIVERATGKNLEEYFKANIFSPLGIEDITFYPTPQVVERLQTACAPNADDDTVYTHVPSTRPMTSETVGLLSGGAGLFGTAKSYLRFLQGILASSPAATASGTATTTAPKLLSPTGFATLFTNSLPPRSPESKDVYAGLAAQLNRMFYVDTEHVANDAQYIEHSVGLVLNTRDSRHGRKAGSGCWDGAAKTHYWLDPTTGIAGICFTQLLVFSPGKPSPFVKTYNAFERTVYDALA